MIGGLQELKMQAISVGVDAQDSQKALALAEQYPDLIWASAGVHPHDAADSTDWRVFEKMAYSPKIIAIGECGLDYYKLQPRSSDIENLQKDVFIKQIELSKKLNKPLIIHCRPSSLGAQDAYEDAIEILKSKNLNLFGGVGVAHFFGGSKEIVGRFLDLGFYISFAGPITFAEEYGELVKFVPSDRILAETDAPFAAPVPHRGERNEPAFINFIIRKIAEWKSMSFEEAAETTAANVAKLFRL